jgi:hypothetical protein
MEFLNQFLIPEKQNPNSRQGIPHSWVRKEWHTALLIIHMYITCEGRFSLVHIYHIRLLIHVNGDYPLNLPYLLLNILSKMSKRIQSHPATAKNSLFHQGLIKMLVLFSLNEVQRSWDWLIQSLNPNPEETNSKKVKEKKPGKGEKISQATEVLMKENSSTTRITRSCKRKLQTRKSIGDFPMGKLNVKITTSQGKKLKIDEETDIFFDPDIKKELDEPKDYTISPVQSLPKQKKQPIGKRLQKVRNRVRRRHMYLNTLEEILPGMQTNSG